MSKAVKAADVKVGMTTGNGGMRVAKVEKVGERFVVELYSVQYGALAGVVEFDETGVLRVDECEHEAQWVGEDGVYCADCGLYVMVFQGPGLFTEAQVLAQEKAVGA